jgi:hypothetical protein
VEGEEKGLPSSPAILHAPPSTRVKITDFGLARMTDDVTLTQNGVVAGTPEYMSPEQARGEPVDRRADLYSLGSVLYAMCTGVPPFQGATLIGVLRRVSEEAPVAVRVLNPEVPVWLEDLILRLMAKRPEQRIESAVETARLLEGYLAHLQQPSTVNVPKLQPLARKGLFPCGNRPQPLSILSFRIWVPLLIFLIALGLGVRSWFLTANEKGQPAQKHAVFDFRSGLERYPALSLQTFDITTVVKTNEEGLRITLPGGQSDTRPVKLRLGHRLRGDFNIVLGYELLKVGAPVPKFGAGVVMRAWFDAPASPSAMLSRCRQPTGEDRFGAHKTIKGPDGKDQYVNNRHDKPTRSNGKLRLARTGPTVHFLAADDGGEFKTIMSARFGTGDIQVLDVDCHTMYAPIALDIRLTELVLDADDFPDGLPFASDPAVPAEDIVASTGALERKGLLTAVMFSVLTLFALGAMGVWLVTRRKKATARTAALVSPEGGTQPQDAAGQILDFACAACGKKLKINAVFAGKKVKCPACSEVVRVPGGKRGEQITGRL